MNLHITPSFNIDRLCKTASVLLFLVILAYYIIDIVGIKNVLISPLPMFTTVGSIGLLSVRPSACLYVY